MNHSAPLSVAEVATRACGQPWGAADRVFDDPRSDTAPRLVTGASGEVTMVWAAVAGGLQVVESAVRAPVGSWGPPETLSDPGQDTSRPAVVAGADGAVTAIWSSTDGRSTMITTRSRRDGGAWGGLHSVSGPDRAADDPCLVVDPVGNLSAVWVGSTAFSSVVQASMKPVGGGWGLPVDLSDTSKYASDPAIAVGSDGRVTAAWALMDGSLRRIQVRGRSAGGVWGPVQTVSETRRARSWL